MLTTKPYAVRASAPASIQRHDGRRRPWRMAATPPTSRVAASTRRSSIAALYHSRNRDGRPIVARGFLLPLPGELGISARRLRAEVVVERLEIAHDAPRGLRSNDLGPHQVGEAALEWYHSLVAPGLDGAENLRRLALADQVGDAEVDAQELHRRDAALAVGARQEPLRDHGAQRVGELYTDLPLALGRIRVDDALDGRRTRAAVEARQDQVTRLGGGQRQADRLRVAHLADQQDVGVLSQSVAQAGGEVAHLASDLALAHEPPLATCRDAVLDRVLESD